MPLGVPCVLCDSNIDKRAAALGGGSTSEWGALRRLPGPIPAHGNVQQPCSFPGPPWGAPLSCTDTTCHVIWRLGTFSVLIFKHMLLFQNFFFKRVYALFPVSYLGLWFNIGIFVFLDVSIFLKQYMRSYARYDLFNFLSLHPLSLHHFRAYLYLFFKIGVYAHKHTRTCIYMCVCVYICNFRYIRI